MQKEIAYDEAKRKKHLKKFNEEYPQYVTGIVGRSILGKDIDYYKIGNGKKHILAVGAHNGMEYITAAALYEFIDFFSEKATRGAIWNEINLQFLLQKFTYWIIPCMNPDGVDMNLCGIEKTPLYERQLRMNGGSTDFTSWQANARGVDLNHNYNYGFLEYKRIEADKGIQAGKNQFSGEYPESEPETKSLANLVRTVAPTALVSFRSQGGEIFANPENEYVKRVAKRVASSLGYKLSKAEVTASFGGLSGYTGEGLGIPSFAVKLGKEKNPLPASAFPSICDTVRKALVFLPTRL